MPKRGGVDFKELCDGKVGYSFNPANIKSLTVELIESKLVETMDETMKLLQDGTKKTIKIYYFGKTHISKTEDSAQLSIVDPNTWKMGGIGSRWRWHKDKVYCKDGLVVLGVFTRETLPESVKDHEQFALSMEQTLTKYYLYHCSDSRVHNKTFTAGRLSGAKYCAYCVYMTFTYDELHVVENGKVLQEDEQHENLLSTINVTSPTTDTEQIHITVTDNSSSSPSSFTDSQSLPSNDDETSLTCTAEDPILHNHNSSSSSTDSDPPINHLSTATIHVQHPDLLCGKIDTREQNYVSEKDQRLLLTEHQEVREESYMSPDDLVISNQDHVKQHLSSHSSIETDRQSHTALPLFTSPAQPFAVQSQMSPNTPIQDLSNNSSSPISVPNTYSVQPWRHVIIEQVEKTNLSSPTIDRHTQVELAKNQGHTESDTMSSSSSCSSQSTDSDSPSDSSESNSEYDSALDTREQQKVEESYEYESSQETNNVSNDTSSSHRDTTSSSLFAINPKQRTQYSD